MATPTMKRKKGKMRSVGVQPFQSAWRSGLQVLSQSPGSLTRIMPAMVAPRKTSREPRRSGRGSVLMDHLLPLAAAAEGEDVLGALEEGADEGHVQALRGDAGVPQGGEPGEELAGRRRLLVAALAQLVEDPQRGIEQPLLDVGEMELDDLAHLLRRGKGDVVAEAAPQEGIGELPLGVRGDQDERAQRRLDRLVDLADGKLAVLQHVEEVVLHVRFGLVDLVEEEDGPLLRPEGAADRSPDHVVEEVVHVAAVPKRASFRRRT